MDLGDEKIDYSQFSPEFLSKLEQFQKRRPEFKQLEVLSDIASMVHELINVADQSKTNTDQIKAIGAVLTDSREQLVAIANKQSPEIPDFSSPIVKALDKLESAINKLDVKPQLNPTFKPNIRVDAPQVDVQSPDVNVDTKPIATILKNDIPQAFDKAISSIPKPAKIDLSSVEDKLDEAIEQLKDIDTGVRLKPQPGSMRVTNTTGGEVGGGYMIDSEYDYLAATYPTSVTETLIFKSGGSGGATVATLNITYTDSSKEVLTVIAKT